MAKYTEGETILFRVDRDGETLAGIIETVITESPASFNGWTQDLGPDDLPCYSVSTAENGPHGWLVPESWVIPFPRDGRGAGPTALSARDVLERVAVLIAQDGEIRTDGECLGDVWTFLESCGVDPDKFRNFTEPF